MALTKIPSNLITADAISGSLIADDAIDSEHIVDGAIDAAHMSANSIDSDSYVDGSIDTAHIGDDQVTADKLANSINTSIAAKLPLSGGTLTGALVGTSSTMTGGFLGGSNGGIRIHSGGAKFFNITASNVAQDATMDIGASDARFKDLWLAGHISIPATKRLYLDGSGDTFIEESSANTMSFVTGNTQRIEIDSNGTVSASTAYRVTTDGSASSPNYQVGGDADTGMYQPGTNQLGFTVAGSRKMYFSTTTGYIQNLSGGVALTGTLILDGLSNYTGLEVKGSGASRPQIKFTNVNQGVLGSIYGTEGNALVITSGTGGATAIGIDSSQKVGIGTASPSRNLTVSSSGQTDLAIIAGTSASAQLQFGDSGDDNIGQIEYNNSENSMSFFTNATERLFISNAGIVGIGSSPSNHTSEIVTITTPASGGGQGIAFKRLDSNNDQQVGQIRFSNNSTDNLAYIRCITDGDNTSSRLEFHTNTASGTNANFVIKKNGTIGMGQGSGGLAGSMIINNDGATGTINNAYYNTGYGWEVFDDLTSGDSNTVMGNQAGYKLAAGSSNTFIGKSAGEQTVDATENTAMGKDSLKDNSSGAGNTAVGVESLSNLQSGSENVGVGKLSGYTGTSFANSTFVGYQAGRLTTGSSNTYLGHTAGRNARAGGENVAIGKEALLSATNSDASNNVAVGVETLKDTSSGTQNVAVGKASGQQASGGSFNTFLGAYTGQAVGGGNYNTCIGYQAGKVATGTNNILLGKDAGMAGSPGGAVSNDSNHLVIGDENIGNFYCTQTSISSSDERDKADITNFTGGLDWIKAMRPVTYKWDKRVWYADAALTEGEELTPEKILAASSDGSLKVNDLQVGLIAQEVLDVEKANGYGANNENSLLVDLTKDETRYGLKYSLIVPVLVSAIKEQQTIIDDLKTRIETLGG